MLPVHYIPFACSALEQLIAALALAGSCAVPMAGGRPPQVKLSPSGGRIAFTVVTDPGSEAQKAHVRELPIGCAIVWDLAQVEGVGTLEWLGEEHILFTRPDASGRPHQVRACGMQRARSLTTLPKSSKCCAI
jgi:hypothetical protein